MMTAIQLASKGRGLRAIQQVLANLEIAVAALAEANLPELESLADRMLDDAAEFYKQLDGLR